MREGCFCDEQLNQQEDLELPTLGNDNKSAYSLSGFQKSEYQTNEIELSKITSLPVHSVKEDENFKCSKGNKRMSTCAGMINVGFEDQNDNSEKDTNDKSVTVEDDSSRLIYKVSEKPPLQSSIFFAFQVSVIVHLQERTKTNKKRKQNKNKKTNKKKTNKQTNKSKIKLKKHTCICQLFAFLTNDFERKSIKTYDFSTI